MRSKCSEHRSFSRFGLFIVAIVVLTGCNRIGHDPISWLTVIISAAAGLAFYLQLFKDW